MVTERQEMGFKLQAQELVRLMFMQSWIKNQGQGVGGGVVNVKDGKTVYSNA